MSAFILSDAHINALVTWAAYRRRDVSYYWQGSRRQINGDEKRIASVLYAENVRSVNSRYQEHEPAHGFRYRISVRDIQRAPVEIIKACHCYEYQACETDDWEQSEAHAVIRAIESEAVRRLPGYDAAPWEIADEVAA